MKNRKISSSKQNHHDDVEECLIASYRSNFDKAKKIQLCMLMHQLCTHECMKTSSMQLNFRQNVFSMFLSSNNICVPTHASQLIIGNVGEMLTKPHAKNWAVSGYLILYN